ncbi:MAG TPA: sigma 54-interacting transcriptional regulator [Candidatus Sulfotelmatobacter sp.]|nr:sigma 54-interacting transcriptional regulator [Candidatus Sulfotelmatobacter sp.]
MLRSREPSEILDNIPGQVVVLTADGTLDFINRPVREYFGLGLEQLKGWITSDAIHPDDLPLTISTLRHAIKSGQPYQLDTRFRRFDGIYRWFHHDALPIRDADGRILNWYVLFTDIHERKTTEQELRRSEESLHEAQTLSHTGSWKIDVLSGAVVMTPEMVRICGLDSGDDSRSFEYLMTRVHPEDRERVQKLFEHSVAQETNFQIDHRVALADGTIRYVHSIGHRVVNESGQLIEFFGTTVDVTEHWQARAELERALEEIERLKNRLQHENLALREEITRSSMFEEIVGSSQPLRKVLDQLARVALTDFTVLISGETGTGKELIARAIHKRSNRSARPFISVNCGAIPQSLIASELFGYEKGAFTGALQRRIGRFEAADGGTIFFDEVGELPMETQIALLRVLQEREFERIGSSERQKLDVRILAATNRNLQDAVSAGTFRQDLFYRLNVFPIEMPPLRERTDDIRLLAEYLIDRYAKQAGKRFMNIASSTLDLFENYLWPGNVRELQNVIERAVVLCDEPTFLVDETWLKPSTSIFNSATSRLVTSTDNEREGIEAALAESRGRVSGPSGAAAKLGIPRQTLESKILRLGINRHRFRT